MFSNWNNVFIIYFTICTLYLIINSSADQIVQCGRFLTKEKNKVQYSLKVLNPELMNLSSIAVEECFPLAYKLVYDNLNCISRPPVVNLDKLDQNSIELFLLNVDRRIILNEKNLTTYHMELESNMIKICWNPNDIETSWNENYYALRYQYNNGTKLDEQDNTFTTTNFNIFHKSDTAWKFIVDDSCDLEANQFDSNENKWIDTVCSHTLDNAGFFEKKIDLKPKNDNETIMFKIKWQYGSECYPRIYFKVIIWLFTTGFMSICGIVLWFLLIIFQNVFRKKDSQELKYYQLDHHMRKAIIPETKEPILTTFNY